MIGWVGGGQETRPKRIRGGILPGGTSGSPKHFDDAVVGVVTPSVLSVGAEFGDREVPLNIHKMRITEHNQQMSQVNSTNHG